MILLDGKKISLERAELLKQKVSDLSFVPKLVIIRVGERTDTTSYVNKKVEYGELIGVKTEVIKFEEDSTQEEIENKIFDLNKDASVNGIIVQLPLPDNFNASEIIEKIDPDKDVDGLTSTNVRKLVNSQRGIVPATPKGILTLLSSSGISVSGKNVVVLGRSLLVGKTTSLYLTNYDATVTNAHSKTENLPEVTKQADILIVAIGKPNLIDKKYVSVGQVIVDVGISPLDDKITGDVNFDEVKGIVSAISPVPGGVGPMTVVSLFENLIEGL